MESKLKKIISGGQTGVDRGGLLAARDCGIATGGTAPHGYLTENGPDPTLASFNLVEHNSSKYPPRTLANVRNSDGTVRIAVNFNSRGEVCTKNAINKFKAPSIDVLCRKKGDRYFGDKTPEQVAEWCMINGIYILNVAGNRESRAPGIQEFTRRFISDIINLY